MDLTELKARRIISPHGDLRLGEPVEIVDEGSFYRINGTTIIDKFKIVGIEEDENRVEIMLKDGVVVLETV